MGMEGFVSKTFSLHDVWVEKTTFPVRKSTCLVRNVVTHLQLNSPGFLEFHELQFPEF